jgi:photosystem II stability/assembly factor-like uncharacterized protein
MQTDCFKRLILFAVAVVCAAAAPAISPNPAAAADLKKSVVS